MKPRGFRRSRIVKSVSHRVDHQRDKKNSQARLLLPERLGLLLRALVLMGYPLVAVSVAYVDIDPSIFTTTYRIFVVSISILILMFAFTRKLRGRLDALLIVFLGLYFLRLVYDWQFAEIPQASDALLFFIVVVVVPITAANLAGSTTYSDVDFAYALLPVALGIVILAALGSFIGVSFNPWQDYGAETNRLGFEALNPISLGHAAGTSILVSFFLMLEARSISFRIFLAFVCLFVASFVMFEANSRGPIIAAAFAIVWLVLLRIRKLMLVAIALSLSPILLAMNTEFLDPVLDRFSFGSELDQSAIARLEVQQAAINAFLEHPILGSYYIDPSLGAGNYPHNIAIETAMSMGILGLLLLAALLIRAWGRIVSNFAKQRPLICLLFAQQFIAVQFSNAIWGMDAFFLMLSLVLASGAFRASNANLQTGAFRHQFAAGEDEKGAGIGPMRARQ